MPDHSKVIWKPPRWLGAIYHAPAALTPWIVLAAAGLAFYGWDAPTNPPGFFVDESSIAYNALTIAESGSDEHGERWPLYFRAFGDYKNPTYIYALAAIYRLTGPDIASARYLSAALGVLAALALGLLGAQLTGRSAVGLLTLLMALATPWLFELSRVVLEVAAYPLTVTLVLLCSWKASRKSGWTLVETACLAASLGLVTYTYSTGRLYAPLLALGLGLLVTGRVRVRSILTTWALYALILVPLLMYQLRHPDALTKRFSYLTYASPDSGYADAVGQFVMHYLGNLSPWNLLISGDPNIYQIASIPGVGVVLVTTFVLAVPGAWLAVRSARHDPWWRFFVYGLATSVVPASLTNDNFHMLRLGALPVFIIALCAPAFGWLLAGGSRYRLALVALVALTFAQGAFFRWQFELSARSPWRLHLFDVDYPALILPAALAASPRAIYIADSTAIPGYIQARWYAAARDIPRDTVRVLLPEEPPPDGAVVIRTDGVLNRCRLIAMSEPYAVCAISGPPRQQEPLGDGDFHAEVRAVDVPREMRTRARAKIRVAVTNRGGAQWHVRERALSPQQVTAGSRWLDVAGRVVVGDDGRGALPHDLLPGQEADISFNVNTPGRPGDYLLEVDMLQETVSWFALKGSPTLRVPVRVE